MPIFDLRYFDMAYGHLITTRDGRIKHDDDQLSNGMPNRRASCSKALAAQKARGSPRTRRAFRLE